MAKTKALALSRPTGLVQVSPLATATDQVQQLTRVLAPNLAWSSVKLGALKPADRPEAEATLAAVRTVLDTAEKGRKMLTKPLLDQKGEIDAVYNTIKKVCAGLDQHIWKLIQYSREEERQAAIRAAEKEAKRAEKKGHEQLAEDIREQATNLPALSELTEQNVVRADVVDLHALLRAIIEGAVPAEAITPNMAVLGKLVKAGIKVPGVEKVIEVIGKRSRG